MENGGFHQYFLNPTGVCAPEAILGLRLLEMPRAAALTMKAALMFGPEYPRDQETREPLLDRLTKAVTSKSTWDPFEALNDAFYDLAEVKSFDARANEFVRRNMDMFFR